MVDFSKLSRTPVSGEEETVSLSEREKRLRDLLNKYKDEPKTVDALLKLDYDVRNDNSPDNFLDHVYGLAKKGLKGMFVDRSLQNAHPFWEYLDTIEGEEWVQRHTRQAIRFMRSLTQG